MSAPPASLDLATLRHDYRAGRCNPVEGCYKAGKFSLGGRRRDRPGHPRIHMHYVVHHQDKDRSARVVPELLVQFSDGIRGDPIDSLEIR